MRRRAFTFPATGGASLTPFVGALAAAMAVGVPAAGQAVLAPAPSLSAIARAVKPGSWTYTSRATVEGKAENVGSRTLTVAGTSYAGSEAWLVVDSQRTPAATAVDSLYARRADFAALRRALRLGARGERTPTRIILDFTNDSVTGRSEARGETRPIALVNARNALASDGALLAALAALPLRAGWLGALSVFTPRGEVTPLTLGVVGRERVAVPAGSYDAWVVEATDGAVTATYYVAVGGPVVRVVAPLPQPAGVVIETVLEAASPTP